MFRINKQLFCRWQASRAAYLRSRNCLSLALQVIPYSFYDAQIEYIRASSCDYPLLREDSDECTAVTAPCPLRTYLEHMQVCIWSGRVDSKMARGVDGQLATLYSSVGAWHTGACSSIPDS